MHDSFVESLKLMDLPFWERIKDERKFISFDLELTARCNNNCRHCYINLPANEQSAERKELSLSKIKNIVEQAVELGALWCLITGGEPLLRDDFFDIYLYLKKKGLLISVFTNATLITEKHIQLFKKYPPRDIEVTIYGVSRETYERVTRKAGSFDAFMQGLNLLLKNNIRVRLKTMALRSNINELTAISEFCLQRTKEYFRFDPFLHLRFDGNKKRNAEIKSERLSPEEIVTIEHVDSERFRVLKKGCDKLIMPELAYTNCNHLFRCGAGNSGFTISYDGFFRLCSSLCHPDCIFDLKKGRLFKAWNNFVLRVRDMRSQRDTFLKKCRVCSIINLCIWCPAHAYLETREMDKPVDYFCAVAHARAKSIRNRP